MKGETTFITQTQFYSPVFNAAIFDGPLRLYFAQASEPEALRVYFDLQDDLESWSSEAKSLFKKSGRVLFVMLYPDRESFEASFGDQSSLICHARLGQDEVLGICGPLDEEDHVQIQKQLQKLVQAMRDVFEARAQTQVLISL